VPFCALLQFLASHVKRESLKAPGHLEYRRTSQKQLQGSAYIQKCFAAGVLENALQARAGALSGTEQRLTPKRKGSLTNSNSYQAPSA